jgi:hypothetical protein
MPACNLHYTTSHDPKQQQHQIDADAKLASVASLPTVNADISLQVSTEIAKGEHPPLSHGMMVVVLPNI